MIPRLLSRSFTSEGPEGPAGILCLVDGLNIVAWCPVDGEIKV